MNKLQHPLFALHFSFLLLLALASCHRVSDALDSADRLMFEAPDSAVAMLDSLDVRSASRALRAGHALLLTKAREKANITVTDDSLIAIAADYYRGRGDSLEVQSLFYHGVILGYRDDYPRALLSLIQAADLADAIGDDFYRAMACREQVGVYTRLYEFDRAARLGEEAVRAFNRAGRPLHAAWERVFIPQSLLYSGNVDAACDTIAVLVTDSLIQSDPHLRQEFLYIATNVYYKNNDFEQSENYFDAYIYDGGAPSSKMLSQMAELHLAKGDFAEARRFYDLAVDSQLSSSDSLATLAVLSQIYEAEGDFKNAHSLNIAVQNAATHSTNDLISHPYTGLLNDYFHSEVSRQSLLLDEASLRTIIWILIAVILSAAIIALILTHRRALRRRDVERNTLINDLGRLESQISMLNQQLINQPAGKKSAAITLLNAICEARNSMLSGDEGQRRFVNSISSTIASLSSDEILADIEDFVNANSRNLMAKFREQLPGLTDKQYRIALLTFFGLSPSSISAIMQYSSSSAVRNIRARIRKAIQEHPSPDSGLFLPYFSAQI